MKLAILSSVAWRTPPRNYGPWEQVASNLTEGLVAKGHDVTLFATGDSITSGKLMSSCRSGYAEDASADAKVNECLHISALMEQSGDFDIIHNHFDFLPLTYSKLIHTPMVTTIHGFSSPLIVPVYKKYNNHNNYVAISNANRHPQLDYMATVYNGIDTKQLQYRDTSDGYLLFFGRIHPDKGTLEAVEVAKKSKRRIIIAGLVQDTEYFKDLILPLIDNIQVLYVGNCDPKRRNQLLGGASALLHPISFDEPFGLSVAEAMCCGTPVIAFNRGSMGELIQHGNTGYLVNSVPEAVEAVEMISQIDRKRCNEWAVRMFSQERMVEQYIELYERLVK